MHQDTFKVEQYVIISFSPPPFNKKRGKVLITKCGRQSNTHCSCPKNIQYESREMVNILYCSMKEELQEWMQQIRA